MSLPLPDGDDLKKETKKSIKAFGEIFTGLFEKQEKEKDFLDLDGSSRDEISEDWINNELVNFLKEISANAVGEFDGLSEEEISELVKERTDIARKSIQESQTSILNHAILIGVETVVIKKLLRLHNRAARIPLDLLTQGISKGALFKDINRRFKRRKKIYAVTETASAWNYTQLRIAHRETDDAFNSRKTFRTAQDELVCPVCGPLNGKSILLDRNFTIVSGSIPYPPLHVNCRCWVSYSVEKAN